MKTILFIRKDSRPDYFSFIRIERKKLYFFGYEKGLSTEFKIFEFSQIINDFLEKKQFENLQYQEINKVEFSTWEGLSMKAYQKLSKVLI